ncbi:MAG: DUF1292 domain-containing protein [Lachnospiraceae bacterium]|nr:DUF1292 domain-containing protein [Lachnospiraceae bacterium]
MNKENQNQNPENDEEMTVTLTLEDDTEVTCSVVTILTVEEKDYIVLLPVDEAGNQASEDVWIYGYHENENDPNEEPELIFIEDDEEYDKVAEAFDEFLDEQEFDELNDD